jgi:hypothetical protein
VGNSERVQKKKKTRVGKQLGRMNCEGKGEKKKKTLIVASTHTHTKRGVAVVSASEW